MDFYHDVRNSSKPRIMENSILIGDLRTCSMVGIVVCVIYTAEDMFTVVPCSNDIFV